MLAQVAGAQTFYQPVLPDATADPGPGQATEDVRHTGTDVIIDPRGNRVQAMVWDNRDNGGLVKLSWAVTNSVNPAGSNHLDISVPGGSASDPDVVMAYHDGDVYANVVYLATTGGSTRTYWAVYRWDAGSQTFTLAVAPQALGSPDRNHSSPNIDANSHGEVGIVWEEFIVETATITVTNPSYPAGYTYTQQNLALADSYVLPARIDGTVTFCNSLRGILVSADPGPQDPPVLFNQSLNPDVAVGLTGLISVAYINSYAVATASPVITARRLVVRQLRYEDCRPSALVDSREWYEGVSVGTPRIAASTKTEDEVEIALDWRDTYCEEGVGPRTYAEIHNFGKSDGRWRDGFTTVSLPYRPGEDSPETIEPAIAYLNQEGENFYVIDWTAYDYDKGGNGQQRDVWSRTFRAGDPVGQDFSRVNSFFDGNQQAPSVAARYNDDPRTSVHLFNNEALSTVYYKQTVSLPGTGPLFRPATAAATALAPETGAVLQAYPNPSAAGVNFRLRLSEGEQVKELAVYDLLGRVVDRVDVRPAAHGSSSELTWQPKAELPQGVYQVRLTTTRRTVRTAINRVR
jgi:hypothetical protein